LNSFKDEKQPNGFWELCSFLAICELASSCALHSEDGLVEQGAENVENRRRVALTARECSLDVVEHAQTILNGCGGRSAGAYSQSNGIEVIRKHVSEYITNRDGGIASDPENIILSERVEIVYQPRFAEKNWCNGPNSSVSPLFCEYRGVRTCSENYWSYRAIEKQAQQPTMLQHTHFIVHTWHMPSAVEREHRRDYSVYQDNIYDEECKFHSFKKDFKNIQFRQ
uniref:Uncharacterized protein n=1 Tax=Parascaris equorum TaxID=6256 RepID=A0A914RS98_PAREQ